MMGKREKGSSKSLRARGMRKRLARKVARAPNGAAGSKVAQRAMSEQSPRVGRRLGGGLRSLRSGGGSGPRPGTEEARERA